jgi:hypothetical protein
MSVFLDLGLRLINIEFRKNAKYCTLVQEKINYVSLSSRSKECLIGILLLQE